MLCGDDIVHLIVQIPMISADFNESSFLLLILILNVTATLNVIYVKF